MTKIDELKDRLDLIITQHLEHRDGWSYEWQDQHGKVVCCGFTYDDVHIAAHKHIDEVLKETAALA